MQQKQELSVVDSKDKTFDETKNIEQPEAGFKDESAARALYEKMIETMRDAENLSYTSNYQFAGRSPSTYTIWMKKPNHFHVQTINSRGIECGTLIGDGDFLWIFWPGDRPHLSSEDGESYEKSKSQVFMKEATPLVKHSIGHKTDLLGAGMSMPIIDPSTFHGYTDSLQPYIDGISTVGIEKVGAPSSCRTITERSSGSIYGGRGDRRAARRCVISRNYTKITRIKDWSPLALIVQTINRSHWILCMKIRQPFQTFWIHRSSPKERQITVTT